MHQVINEVKEIRCVQPYFPDSLVGSEVETLHLLPDRQTYRTA